MTKDIAVELALFVADVAERFSKKDREMNLSGESFAVDEINATSEHTAVVIFKKNTGKTALAFFYYIPNGASKGWRYFFPTDSHINGFRAFEYYKFLIEKDNYKFNF